MKTRAQHTLRPETRRVLEEMITLTGEMRADGQWLEMGGQGARPNEVAAQTLFHWADKLQQYCEAKLREDREQAEVEPPKGDPGA